MEAFETFVALALEEDGFIVSAAELDAWVAPLRSSFLRRRNVEHHQQF
jgi:hypothetical protein